MMKKVVLIFALAAMVLEISACGTSVVHAPSDKYNGSEDMFLSYDMTETKELLTGTTIIVTGQAIGERQTVKRDVFSGKNEIAEKFEKKFNKPFTVTYTLAEFQIAQVLSGDPSLEGETITIRQRGSADTDIGENKLLNDESLLLLLGTCENDEYKLTVAENSAFTIQDDGTLIAHGNDTAVQQYDGMPAEDFFEDISVQMKMNVQKWDLDKAMPAK